MGRIIFEPMGRVVERPGAVNVLRAARDAEVPLAASCGAAGVCLACRVRVLRGADALTPPTFAERRARDFEALGPDDRLACQSAAEGEVAVTTDYWGGAAE